MDDVAACSPPLLPLYCTVSARHSLAMSTVAQDKSAHDERKLEAGGASSPPPSTSSGLHPAFYIALWICMSSSVILFNKWVLAAAHFDFPLFLTSWHMIFATAMTQILARFTTVLDSRHKVPMDSATYM